MISEVQQLRLEVSHLTRRLAQQPIGWTQKRRTSEMVSLFDERADLKVEVARLKKENAQLKRNNEHLAKNLSDLTAEFNVNQAQMADSALRICQLKSDKGKLLDVNAQLRADVALLTQTIEAWCDE